MNAKQKDVYDCLISMAGDVRSGRYGGEDFDEESFNQDLIDTFELEV